MTYDYLWKVCSRYNGWLKLAGKLEEAQAKFPHLKEQLQELSKSDPSGSNKYLTWGIKQLEKGHSLNDLLPTLRLFHQKQNLLEKKDIHQYVDLKDLENLLKDLDSKSKRQVKKEEVAAGSKKIFEDDSYLLVRIDNKKASQAYGANTKWCITMESANYYEQYRSEDVEFYFLIRKKAAGNNYDKVAIAVRHDGTGRVMYTEFFNAIDEPYSENEMVQSLFAHSNKTPQYFENLIRLSKEDAVERPFSIYSRIKNQDLSSEEFEKAFVGQLNEASESTEQFILEHIPTDSAEDLINKFPKRFKELLQKYPDSHLYWINNLSSSSSSNWIKLFILQNTNRLDNLGYISRVLDPKDFPLLLDKIELLNPDEEAIWDKIIKIIVSKIDIKYLPRVIQLLYEHDPRALVEFENLLQTMLSRIVQNRGDFLSFCSEINKLQGETISDLGETQKLSDELLISVFQQTPRALLNRSDIIEWTMKNTGASVRLFLSQNLSKNNLKKILPLETDAFVRNQIQKRIFAYSAINYSGLISLSDRFYGWIKIAGKLEEALEKYPNLKDSIQELSSRDPSKNNKYLNWGIQQLQNGYSLNDIIPTLELFHKKKDGLEKKDINQYSDLKELENLLKNLSESKRQIKKQELASGSKKIYENDEYAVVRIDSKKACQIYGANTKWCITMENASYYESYTASNVLFYFLLRKKPEGDKYDKIAWVVQRDLDNSVLQHEWYDQVDDSLRASVILSHLGSSIFETIRDVIDADAKTVPASVLVKLKNGTASKEEYIAALKQELNLPDMDNLTAENVKEIACQGLMHTELGQLTLNKMLHKELLDNDGELLSIINNSDPRGTEYAYSILSRLSGTDLIKLINNKSFNVQAYVAKWVDAEYLPDLIEKISLNGDVILGTITKRIDSKYYPNILKKCFELTKERPYFRFTTVLHWITEKISASEFLKLFNSMSDEIKLLMVRSITTITVAEQSKFNQILGTIIMQEKNVDVRREAIKEIDVEFLDKKYHNNFEKNKYVDTEFSINKLLDWKRNQVGNYYFK